jgi:hypothetical protein
MGFDATTVLAIAISIGAWTLHHRPIIASAVLVVGIAVAVWPF